MINQKKEELSMKYQNGEDFLNHLNKNMHTEDIIMHHANKSDTPEEKIRKYMERLEKTHQKAKTNEHKLNILKQLYYNKYVIKTLPESYINLQKRIAREKGYGDIEITEELKNEMLSQIQQEQKNSLRNWIEYFCSDDAVYPMWFKNYAFEGMVKLGIFDKEKQEFLNRTKNTTAPYIDLNREVLAQVYDVLIHQIGENELSSKEEKALENGESFKKLYTYFFKKVVEQEKSQETEGIWIKYDQGSDYYPLWKSIQGKNTGWCTVGETVAKEQLENGDFYIYYTKDKNKEYKNPRIAIRMDGKSKIGEIRGIAKEQNIESNMEKILDEKLNKFPDKEKYQKKVSDMKYLTILEKKQDQNLEFSIEDLTFLYEVKNKIEGFGWETDPRIKEILQKRNPKKDLANIFKVPEKEIATSLSEFKGNANISVFYGELLWNKEKIPSYFSKLKIICGNAYFESLISAKGLESLQNIGEKAYFYELTSAEGLNALQNIGRSARFPKLTSARGLESLQNIGRNAHFDKLTDARGLKSLQNIGGNAYFYELTSAKGLERLQNIGEGGFFGSLTSAKGFKSLQTIRGEAFFGSLTSAKGLDSLQNIGESAIFGSLTNARGLDSLQIIGGDAYFSKLTSAEGLNLLQNIGGEACFDNLTSAKGLESLQSIKGNASFDILPNAEGLNALQNIGGGAQFNNLDNSRGLESLQRIKGGARFDNLMSAEGLSALQSIGRSANFNSLTSSKGLESLQNIGGNARFDHLLSAKGLKSLQNIEGNVFFTNLKSAEGLNSLQNIEGNADFTNLESAKGLNSLQNIGGNVYFFNLESAEGLNSLQNIGEAARFDHLINARGLESLQSIGTYAKFASLTSAVGLNSLQNIGGSAIFDSLTNTEGLESLMSVRYTTNQFIQEIIEKNNQTKIKHHH